MMNGEIIDYPIDEFFGFGAGDEDIGTHFDAAAAEVGVADDMLDRAVSFEVL